MKNIDKIIRQSLNEALGGGQLNEFNPDLQNYVEMELSKLITTMKRDGYGYQGIAEILLKIIKDNVGGSIFDSAINLI